MSDLDATIRKVLEAHGRLLTSPATLGETSDLYEAGLSSHASVNVMLALEDELSIEFPDALLRKSTFRSIESIRQALESLGVGGAAE